MGDDCVPSSEMRWNGKQPDPIDAVLDGGGDGEDVLHVAVIVHDLRATYTPTEPLDIRPELAEFVGAHVGTDLAAVDSTRPVPSERGDAFPPEPRRRKLNSMLGAIGALVATATGKVVLTTAVAAASVGGLHSADVVDVPVLPDTNRTEQPDADVPASRTAPDERDAAATRDSDAPGNSDAAAALTDAVQDWADCVAGAAAAQGDEGSQPTGRFDPRDECGDQPTPVDYGLTDLPDQAADAAHDAVDGKPDLDAPGAPSHAADGPAGGANGAPDGPASDVAEPETHVPETPAATGSDSPEPPSTSTDPAVGGTETRPGGRP
jgi:hypothetical protein